MKFSKNPYLPKNHKQATNSQPIQSMILSSTSRILSMACLSMALLSPAKILAQQVIFPQEQQAGTAHLSHTGQDYVLSNALLSITYTEKDGKLLFGGCPQLNLKPGTELFEIRTENGSQVIKASEMSLVGSIRTINYTANAMAVKGAEKLPGKAIEATFRNGDLTLTWRAVLRDGSHYLRTELKLEAARDTKMFAIIPMIYDVDVATAGSAPSVVGNTRGAVLLSKKIFAGLETPMGINTAGKGENNEGFTSGSWKEDSFTWTPGSQLPQDIRTLGYKEAEVVGTQGYICFKEAGTQTLTFKYSSGNHKLNIVGVDICDLDGNVVSSDYHYGSTGSADNKNIYHLNLPKAGVYRLRYFIETRTETIMSAGNILFSKKVAQPVLIYDLAPGSLPRLITGGEIAHVPAIRALSASTIAAGDILTDNWKPSDWKKVEKEPIRIGELDYHAPHVLKIEQPLTVTSLGTLSAEFKYKTGNHRLNLCGFELVDNNGSVAASDYHIGYTGTKSENNVYRLNIPNKGTFKIRYYAQDKDEAIDATGTINIKLELSDTLHLASTATAPIRGTWSRNTTLKKGEDWKISAVVGLVAPDQARRSFLAYSERERAVPWRTMPAYISWYELNIDRNNDPNYTKNMHDYQCEEVVRQWKKNLYDPYKVSINSFVWDDGWDHYGDWTFNTNFPNGFAKSDALAQEMGSGIGAWLGPVGGYGQSGTYRRNYWKGKGGMQLSNPLYYETFTKAITDLCKGRGYDFRFFKFDGISAQFSAVGPDNGTIGEENAEGIIRAERMVRENIKPDIFFNTTVGTWASPFWFQYTDAVWRQEGDYGEKGNQKSDRERWITYRDALVYKNFVQNSPICPINTLMTHGFILTRYGAVSKNMDYEGILRELRCAFACGSGMVELYNDFALTNSINGGRLWGDIAECIRWQKNNADVLPDIHWVGGNPWTGSKAEIYGWASWNGKKATLALRNPAESKATYHTTLRNALDIPTYIHGSMILSKAFGRQDILPGISEDTPIDIDTPLTLTFPASSVFVFNGRNSDIPSVPVTGVTFNQSQVELAPGQSKALVWDIAPVDATHTSVVWNTDQPNVVTIKDGVAKALKIGEATITVTAEGGYTAQLKVVVKTLPYAINFDKDATAQRQDRVLKSVSITPQGKSPITLSVGEHPKPYTDLTATPIEVESGALLTPSMSWTGAFMHSYVYLDADNNQQFDVKNPNSPELVAFNYYNGQKKGSNGLSSQSNKNPGVGNIPAFHAPTVVGTYRLRFKIDWDNIDPAGSTTAGNELLSNGGSITDLLIKVVAPNGISSPQTTTTNVSSYDLSGRRITVAQPHGLIISKGQKIIK